MMRWQRGHDSTITQAKPLPKPSDSFWMQYSNDCIAPSQCGQIGGLLASTNSIMSLTILPFPGCRALATTKGMAIRYREYTTKTPGPDGQCRHIMIEHHRYTLAL